MSKKNKKGQFKGWLKIVALALVTTTWYMGTKITSDYIAVMYTTHALQHEAELTAKAREKAWLQWQNDELKHYDELQKKHLEDQEHWKDETDPNNVPMDYFDIQQ